MTKMTEFYEDDLLSDTNSIPTLANKKQLRRWGIKPYTSPTKGLKNWEADGSPNIWVLSTVHQTPQFTCRIFYNHANDFMCLTVQLTDSGAIYVRYGRDLIQLGPFVVLGPYYDCYLWMFHQTNKEVTYGTT